MSKTPPKKVISNMDTAFIKQGLRIVAKTYGMNDKQFREAVEDMNSSEYSLVKRCRVCDVKHTDYLEQRKSEIDGLKLKEKLDSDFYNPALLKELLCMTESTSYYPEFNSGSEMMNEKIRSYFTDLKQIGANSGEGVAMSSSFLDVKKVFVIKTNKPNNESSLLHELVVGVYGTNKLREFIPNFSYIFGGFKCSPPSISENGEVDSFCLNNNEAVNYVLYEYIDNAISLKEYINTCSGVEFLSCYIQLLLALKFAEVKISYTHYDAHTENVMMRKVPKYGTKYQIGYPLDVKSKDEIYITTNSVPTFIDYGFSHIKHKSTEYGRVGFEVFSIFSNGSWIFHDLYKILLFSALDALNVKNNEVFEVCRKIFSFFNSIESLEDVVRDQVKDYFSFPFVSSTSKLSVEDFYQHILNQFTASELSFMKNTLDTSIPVLSCQSFCETSKDILSSIGVNDDFLINDISDFYILYTNNETDRVLLKDHLNYNKAMTIQKEKVKTMTDSLEELIINYNISSKFNIQDEKEFKMIRAKFENVITILDLLDRTSYNSRAGEFTAQLFDNTDDVNYFVNMSDELVRKVEHKMLHIYSYIGDLKYEINRMLASGTVFKDNNVQTWYEKTIMDISDIYKI